MEKPFAGDGGHKVIPLYARIKRGGYGVAVGQDAPEKSQNIGCLSNTGLDPLKITKLPRSQIQCWAILGTPAKRNLNGWPITARL